MLKLPTAKLENIEDQQAYQYQVLLVRKKRQKATVSLLLQCCPFIIIPTLFKKKRRGYCNRLRLSVCTTEWPFRWLRAMCLKHYASSNFKWLNSVNLIKVTIFLG